MKHPLIDLSFFRIPIFTIGNIAGFISFILMMFPATLLPLYMAVVLHLPIVQIGWIMAAQAFAMFIVAPFAGHITDKYGYQIPSILGMVISTISLFLLIHVSVDTKPLFIVLSTVLYGIGSGLFQSPNNISVLESVPITKSGITGSLIATVRNFGRVIGVAVAFLLLSAYPHTTDIEYAKSFSNAFYIATLLSIVNVFLISVRLKIKTKVQ